MGTLLTVVGLSVGHWLIWLCCGPLLAFGGGGPGTFSIVEFQALGLTPPLTLAVLAFQGGDFDRITGIRGSEFAEAVLYVFVGLAGYAGSAALVWSAAHARFRKLSGREPSPVRLVFVAQRRNGPRMNSA